MHASAATLAFSHTLDLVVTKRLATTVIELSLLMEASLQELGLSLYFCMFFPHDVCTSVEFPLLGTF